MLDWCIDYYDFYIILYLKGCVFDIFWVLKYFLY